METNSTTPFSHFYELIVSVLKLRRLDRKSILRMMADAQIPENAPNATVLQIRQGAALNNQCATEISKNIYYVLTGPITANVNKSLSCVEYPRRCECAMVIPLLKKLGLNLICKNYRFIFVSIIAEKPALLQYVQNLQYLGFTQRRALHTNSIIVQRRL